MECIYHSLIINVIHIATIYSRSYVSIFALRLPAKPLLDDKKLISLLEGLPLHLCKARSSNACTMFTMFIFTMLAFWLISFETDVLLILLCVHYIYTKTNCMAKLNLTVDADEGHMHFSTRFDIFFQETVDLSSYCTGLLLHIMLKIINVLIQQFG